jgi:pimeloyl-ACP methyl ester carboxylesterase
MIERIARIGRPEPLAGILCEPEEIDPSRPAVLLLNSGVMHHVGACRLSVRLARRIAETSGLPSLRFDFSGIGDSAPRRSLESHEDTLLGEVREVMDHVSKTRGIDRFILFGLCSGAYASFRTAVADERVVAIVQIDGWCFPTRKSTLRAYGPKLASPAAWGRALLRGGAALRGAETGPTGAEIAGVDSRDFEVADFGAEPTRDDVESGLETLVARGVRMLNVFVGRRIEYNYPEQYRDCFGAVDFRDLLTLHYLPDANHIVTDPGHQAEILGWVEGFLAADPRRRASGGG